MDLKHRNEEDWIHLAQNREKWRHVNTVLNLWVSKNSGRLLTSYAAVSFSSTTLLQAVRMTRLRDGRPAILGSYSGWGRDPAVGRSVRLQHSVRIRWQLVTALRMCVETDLHCLTHVFIIRIVEGSCCLRLCPSTRLPP